MKCLPLKYHGNCDFEISFGSIINELYVCEDWIGDSKYCKFCKVVIDYTVILTTLRTDTINLVYLIK